RAPLAKESLDQASALRFENALAKHEAVVQTRVAGERVKRDDRSGLGVATAERHRGDACLDHRPDTHRTRLERHEDLRARQPLETQPTPRSAEREDLGVR